VDCQPDGWLGRIGPFDPVALPCRDEQVISGLERPGGRLVLEPKTSRSRNQQHLLGPGLVVPEAWWARLPGRDDALDPDPVRRGERDDFFVRSLKREVIEHVRG
jgi:hypothetical protein